MNGFGSPTTLLVLWVPFWALWVFALLITGDAGFGYTVLSGTIAMGSAGVLGIGIWRRTDRDPWPERKRVHFYLRHLGLALGFSVIWTASDFVLPAFWDSVPLHELMLSSPVLSWYLVFGMWLYGMIAGTSYAYRHKLEARRQERRARQQEALATKARLRALRSRLQPHFLFNALHTVSALVDEDTRRAEEALEQLGDLLRYTLRDGDDTVPLSEEWRFTRRYLEMEKLRLGDRLRIDVRMDPDALEVEVPPFSLQPLVENAVRHGVGQRPDGGRVTVRASASPDGLEIRILDDGSGLGERGNAEGAGVGLDLLANRLETLYAGAAELELRTRPDGGTEVVVRLPTDRIPSDDSDDGR